MAALLTSLIATVPHLQRMPRKERKALRREHYRLCLEQVIAALEEHEQIETLACAISASRGRGVLVLTDRRLVLCTTRCGLSEWELSTIGAVGCRPANFTMPSAIYLDVEEATHTVVVGAGLVGAGRKWGPVFVDFVSIALVRHRMADPQVAAVTALPSRRAGALPGSRLAAA